MSRSEGQAASGWPPDVPTRSRWRRWWKPLVIGLVGVVLVVYGGAASYVAVSNARRSDRWERRSRTLERNAEALNVLLVRRTADLNGRIRDLNAMAAKVRRARAALARSEGDVSSLEQRQRDLANEKAQLEDERAQLQQVATRYVDCNSGLRNALDAISYQDYAWLDANGQSIADTCAAADSAFNDYTGTYGR